MIENWVAIKKNMNIGGHSVYRVGTPQYGAVLWRGFNRVLVSLWREDRIDRGDPDLITLLEEEEVIFCDDLASAQSTGQKIAGAYLSMEEGNQAVAQRLIGRLAAIEGGLA